MQIRGSARAACAGIAAIAATMTAAVGGAQAADRTVEPLNQYAVSGRVTTDELARAGYDLTEIKSIGNGKLGIVATPAQAAALRDKGAQVQALSQARAMAAPPTMVAAMTISSAPAPKLESTPLFWATFMRPASVAPIAENT